MRIDRKILNLDVPGDMPLVFLDHGLVEQAVAKLIGNAGNYSPDDGPIDLQVRCESGTLVITVSDNGPGLPASSEERIFEKFYRSEPSKPGGLGLGLSIARGFVAAHGGTATGENRPGGGARFTITLPSKTADPQLLERES